MRNRERSENRDNRGQEVQAVLLATILVAALVLPLVAARTTPAGQETAIYASDASSYGWFGIDVDIEDGVIAVGALESSPNKRADPGAVFVLTPDGTGGYIEEKLMASDGQAHDHLGGSVAIDEGRVLTGAWRHNNWTGAAYLFEPDGLGGWTETKFTATDGAPEDRYGFSVALDGDNVVIGAYNKTHSGIDGAGVVYVYQPDGNGSWTETNLTYIDSLADREFGKSVAADQGKILVGAPGHFVGGELSRGAAYLFEQTDPWNWTSQQFLASDGALRDIYGAAVAMEGDSVLIGAPQSDAAAKDAGAAYLYQPDGAGGWSETRFTASDADDEDLNGIDNYAKAVALSQGRVLIGARTNDLGGVQDTGSAYLYEQTSSGAWEELRFASSEVNKDDAFGDAVAMEGETILVSATLDDDKGVNSGTLFRYQPAILEQSQTTAVAQDDGGSGGDASDDPNDPTPLPSEGQEFIFSGTLVPVEDPADVYGLTLGTDTTEELCFEIDPQPSLDIELSLYKPGLVPFTTADLAGAGGLETVCANSVDGEFLEGGQWVLVIEPVTPPEVANSDSTVDSELGLLDYGGKRRCSPACMVS